MHASTQHDPQRRLDDHLLGVVRLQHVGHRHMHTTAEIGAKNACGWLNTSWVREYHARAGDDDVWVIGHSTVRNRWGDRTAAARPS